VQIANLSLGVSQSVHRVEVLLHEPVSLWVERARGAIVTTCQVAKSVDGWAMVAEEAVKRVRVLTVQGE
jgi:hypothetical protein